MGSCFRAFLACVALAAPVLAQDQGGTKKPREDEERIALELQRLTVKMGELARTLREKGQEEYALKLEQGVRKIQTEGVSDKIRMVLMELDNKLIEKAVKSGEEVAQSLQRLLDLLEDRTNEAERLAKMAELKTAVEKVKEIIKREQKIKDETQKLDRDRARDLEQVRKDLDSLIERQQTLQNETESGAPRELMAKMEKAVQEIEKLQAEQKQVEKAFDAAKSKEHQDASELARRLDDLIDRQEKNRASHEARASREKTLDAAIGELEKVIVDQKKAAERSREAAKNPPGADAKALDKEQADLNERTWKLGNDLFKVVPDDAKKKVFEPLSDADNAQKAAQEGLKEGAFDLARGDQELAQKSLEKVRDELKKLKEAASKGKAEETARVGKEQDQIGKDAKALADAMKQSGKSQESPATSKAMENAGQKTDEGSQSAGQAREQMQKGQDEAASKSQKQALDRMAEARQELQSLQNALGKKDQERLKEPAAKQAELSKKAQETAKGLNEMSRTPEAQRQDIEAQREMQRATSEARNAQAALEQAAQQMQQAQSGQAQQSQNQAKQNLQQAKEALQRAAQEMARTPDPDFKKIAEAQKKLEDELREKVTKWLAQKAEEEKDGKKADAMREASKASQQAQGNMQQAQGKAQQSPPQPQQAGREQGEAKKKMEETKKKLDELARRPLNDVEKKKAGEIAKKQDENKELTNELEKQLEQMKRENAKQSAQGAQGKMQQAKKNLEQGEPQEAEKDEEQALEDLKQAQQDLEDALEEMKRQAEEEMLVQLEAELKKIIAAQETVSKATKDLDDIRRRKGAFNREESLRCKGLGTSQENLVRVLEEINKKLTQEDVLVFRYVVESAMDDLREAGGHLRETETGARTQEVQADAVRKLKDLIEAFNIKKRESRKKPPPGGGGGGGGGKKPLVPDIVQLHMMKKLQEELLRKTTEFGKGYRADRDDLSPIEKQVLRRLSDEQGKLGDLMEKFIQKFDDAKKEQGPQRK